MNIFALDVDPKIAASYHCDQHVNKMILESAQLISTAAFYLLTPSRYNIIKPHIYKPAYVNHPCNLWLRESPSGVKFDYLRELSESLNDIRLSYLSSTDDHSSLRVVRLCHQFLCDQFWQPCEPLHEESFIRAMPVIYKHHLGLDSVSAYRLYYRSKEQTWIAKGKPAMQYTGRSRPFFLQAPISVVYPSQLRT